MKLLGSYNKKWLFYVITFFLFFATVLLFIQYRHERGIRIDALNVELDNYSEITQKYIIKNDIVNNQSYSELDSLMSLFPDNTLRLSLIDTDGIVLYDSQIEDESTMENHLYRPEIQEAVYEVFGTDIRLSVTTDIKYYYYARFFNNYFIRISVIYDIEAKQFIQPDLIFMLFIVFILFTTSFSIIIITDKFGKSISSLRVFTRKALANETIDDNLNFPDNELGIIGKEIIGIYKKLNLSREEIISEKEKLIRHLNLLDEGIAIFSKDIKLITSNNNFIQYINHISDKRITSQEDFLKINEFSPLLSFIKQYIYNDKEPLSGSPPEYIINISKNGKFFIVKSIVFNDRSFEVSIQDITKPAKRKLLKQELTENIAHELKTPVSSIKGALETILDSNPPHDVTINFLKRAYSQSCRLADLINDISLLTKIEEASSLYHIEYVDVIGIISEIIQEINPKLSENNAQIDLNLGNELVIKGNSVLIYSVFRNLLDNVLNYAGQDISIRVEKYAENDKYYYFSFSDNGTGVPEQDLPRLFERFYRVDKGRDRKKGGTGLGLAIVKNAIEFHKGSISVKNRNEGGLEFLFTISKIL